MKKLREIVEATKSLHPMALHVKPVMVNGQQKYKVHAVGKDLADGIKHGEHLSDSELDDAHEMGAKVKHVKEEVEQLDEIGDTPAGMEKVKAYRAAVGRQANKTGEYDTRNPDKKSNPFDARTAGHSPKKQAMRIAGAAKAKKIETGTRYEEADFGPEADKNITVQLKKAMDMMEHGEKSGSEIEFADGQKYFVEGVVAHKVLVAMEQMKPEIRAQAQNAVYQSFAHLMAAHQMLSK